MKAVLDASAAVAFVHDEVASGAVRRWIAHWASIGGSLVVPRHFWLEVVNSLAVGKRYDGRAIIEAVYLLRQLEIETIDSDDASLVHIIDLVERHGLTSYDAQYVALAEQLDAFLATFDREMAAAARSRAIDPLTPPRRLAEEKAPYGSERRVTWPDYSGAASYLASLRADVRRASTAS
jgi:predicted nucleic acid-binding protein